MATAPHARISDPLPLPCGVVLPNRIVKAAMSDSLGDGAGHGTPEQARLYERWAHGGAAASIVGEVQGSPDFPERPGNLVVNDRVDQTALQAMLHRATANSHQLWAQLGHAGALAHPPISDPAGPSDLTDAGVACRALTVAELKDVPAAFAQTAVACKDLGFTGVEIHAAHGFLLSQFLSPLFNRRGDAFGGSLKNRARLLHDTIAAVRAAVGPSFPVALKLNATDQIDGGFTEPEALAVIADLKAGGEAGGVDLIDMSGGTYFPGAKSSSDGAKPGPYFLAFGREARPIAPCPIMLTGGFKSRADAANALATGAADAVGLARLLVLDPNLPNRWLTDETASSPRAPRFEKTVPGGVTAWHTMRLTALANDQEAQFAMDLPEAFDAMEARDEHRCIKWNAAFGRS
ncbi:MAG: oxidoreductase [Pseudomonadota bacterium]